MTAPSRKPKDFGMRLNLYYTTYGIQHRTSLYFPDPIPGGTVWETIAEAFASALAPMSSASEVSFNAWSITHPNNFSDPQVSFATPILGSHTTDGGGTAFKSFTLALPGRGTETNPLYKPAPAKLTWFPGRITYNEAGRKYILPTETTRVSDLHSAIQAIGASTISSQPVVWYNRLAVQYNAHVQRKAGA